MSREPSNAIDVANRLAALEAQQELQTDSLGWMLESKWTGPSSVDADVHALDPSIETVPAPPLPTSAAPAPPWQPDWLMYFNDRRNWPMEPQQASWTCSIASLTWLLQATGLDINATRASVAQAIGYPECVNEWNGLESTACLVRVLESYGVSASTAWVGFAGAMAYTKTAAILNGIGWYHFVGLRGQSGNDLWVANSARGYRGVYDTVSYEQFQELGPFQVVYLEPGVRKE